MANATDKLTDDLARVHGLAWALEHRLELEANLKSECKGEVLRFATGVLVSALLVFGGAGYFILKAMVVSEVNNANAAFEAKFKQQFDALIDKDQARFDWKRYHDYGKMYTYPRRFN